jgi:hypothetical protein
MPPSFDAVVDGTPVRKLEFVEVGGRPVTPSRTAAASTRPAEAEVAAPADPPVPVSPGEPRWSLWGDAEV